MASVAAPKAAASRSPASYATVILPVLVLLAYRKSLLRRLGLSSKKLKPAQTPGLALNTPAYELAQRDMFKTHPDGTRELLVPSGGRLRKVYLKQTDPKLFLEHRKVFAKAPPIVGADVAKKGKGKEAIETAKAMRLEGGQAAASAKRVGVNKEFFRRASRALFPLLHLCSRDGCRISCHIPDHRPPIDLEGSRAYRGAHHLPLAPDVPLPARR